MKRKQQLTAIQYGDYIITLKGVKYWVAGKSFKTLLMAKYFIDLMQYCS